MTSTPERLTEAEWRRKVALRECAADGHTYDHVEGYTGHLGRLTLLRVVCGRCGATWSVKQNGGPGA